MIVLGLNGWTDRTHDPAAVVTIDGRIAAFVEQERLSRRKHGIGELPHAAVRTALDLAGIVPSDIDELAYGWDLHTFNRLRGRDVDLSDLAVKVTGLAELRGRPVAMMLHHDAHAASAFYGSGLERAAVLVVDAEGENESATIFMADGSGLRRLRTFGRGRSLGLMYRAVSIFCGFGAFGAGKTMGLAPYHMGEVRPLPLGWDGSGLRTPLMEDAWEDDVVAGWLALLTERFGPACTAEISGRGYPPLDAHHPAAAAAAQAALNEALKALVDEAIRLTGCDDLCLAGGVALNCVANGLLLERVRSLHVPPYPHDAGVALGAAQLVGLRAGQRWTDRTRAQTGTSAGSVIPYAGRAGLAWRETDDPAAVAAESLLSGAMVGWVNGGMEIGPRALGHRSILALPDQASIRQRINALKGREPWRPLAPTLLREDAADLLDRELDSPFMLVSVPLSDTGREIAPAAAHCDGSARVQTVAAVNATPASILADGPEADAQTYRLVLEHIKAETGHGILLNTSLNTRGEPIVRTAEEALSAAIKIGLDVLIVDDVVVRLPGAAERS